MFMSYVLFPPFISTFTLLSWAQCVKICRANFFIDDVLTISRRERQLKYWFQQMVHKSMAFIKESIPCIITHENPGILLNRRGSIEAKLFKAYVLPLSSLLNIYVFWGNFQQGPAAFVNKQKTADKIEILTLIFSQRMI